MVRWKRAAGGVMALMVLLTACRRDPAMPEVALDGPFALELPPGFPFPPTPPDNPLSDAAVRLGKALFFDTRLSRDGTVSCASCHHPGRAFSDTLPLSIGVDGGVGMRNAPPLLNLAYHPALFRDGGVPTLEQQVIAPVHDPMEMDHDIHVAAAALRDEEPYQSLSRLAYDRDLDAFVLTRALAAYERTLISGWSRWDRWMQGDPSALTPAEVNGWNLFNELGCGDCHNGFDLSDHQYHNVGLYLEYADPGRERISQDAADLGKFKTPTLRNIALTAPYMHDGSLPTLEAVIAHFASGGQPHSNRSPAVTGFILDAQQQADLIAFLHALTDERPIDQVP
jgi:cytochrome c peroxidase